MDILGIFPLKQTRNMVSRANQQSAATLSDYFGSSFTRSLMKLMPTNHGYQLGKRSEDDLTTGKLEVDLV